MKQKKKKDRDYLYGMKSCIKICPICGTQKFVTDMEDYVYKIDGKCYCSWTCFRKGKQLIEQNGKRKSNKVTGR